MNTHSMAIILAFKGVASIPGVLITMDASNERVILVHWNGNLIKFTECDDGLYFSDTSAI